MADDGMIARSESYPVSSITISNLEPPLEERLRRRAAARGHSMETEACQILRAALGDDAPTMEQDHLYYRVRARFAPLGGVDLELPAREIALTRNETDFDCVGAAVVNPWIVARK